MLAGATLLPGAPPWPQAQAAALDGGKVQDSKTPVELGAAGWRLLPVPGRAEADFAPAGADGIAVEADRAVAFLYRPVEQGMGPKRRLLFKWRVDRAVPSTDLSRASGDDRSLAVHLVFPLDETELTFWERMEHALTRLVAPPLAGRVLTYVWGGSHPKGTVVANPYLSDMRGKIIILRGRDDAVGRWFREDIDFVADFRKVFGYRPPAPAFLAISADSDDTGSRAVGRVAEIAFEE